MTQPAPTETPSARHTPVAAPLGLTLRVFDADALRVELGADGGDPLSLPAHSVYGDYYRLDPQARSRKLTLTLPDAAGQDAAGRFRLLSSGNRGSSE